MEQNSMKIYYDFILNSIPESIDFNFIPVKSPSVKTLTLTNPTNIPILFKILSKNDYIFSPSEGIIPKSKSISINISINPQQANVLISNAQITLDDKYTKVFKISSIAKYPYLKINKTHFDFGIISIGKTNMIELIINNPEKVLAKFEIKRRSTQPGNHPDIFYMSHSQGEIPPKSSFLIKVRYISNYPGVMSYETYDLETIGGNKIKFSLSGMCTPLPAYVNCKYVNFKSVELGSSMTKLIRVYNDSDIKTEYQIFHNNDGIFSINNTQAVINAHSNVRVNITFRPFETKIYYERVFLLIKNNILYTIDLFGSCHDLLHKTLMINQKFIEMFRYKILHGQYFGSKKSASYLPDELREKEKEINFIKTGNSNIKIDAAANNNNNTNNLTTNNLSLEYLNQLQLYKEMIWESTSKTRIVSFDKDHIDFNFVASYSTSEAYVIKATNNTNQNVNIKWILERPIIKSNLIKTVNLFSNENTIFIVQPEENIIGPFGSCNFKVYFKPNKEESYFYSDIPCQITILDGNLNIKNKLIEDSKNSDKTSILLATTNNFKQTSKNKLKPISQNTTSNFNMSSKNKTNMNFHKKTQFSHLFSQKKQPTISEYFNPPTTNHLSVVGHSFPPGNQIFIPIFEFDPPKEIFFPSTTINQSQYQTLKIINKNDTPLYYNFNIDSSNVFRVHRKYGLIPAKEFHLICIEFCPKEASVYRYPMRIILNHDNVNVKNLILNGLCCDPVIQIEGVKDEIYFPPAFCGITTKKKLNVINISPVKINVKIMCECFEEKDKINEEDAKNDVDEDNNNKKMKRGNVEVSPNEFEMEKNLIKEIDVAFTPFVCEEIYGKIKFVVERIYESHNENIGIFNPGSFNNNLDNNTNAPLLPLYEEDKRTYTRELTILGSGNDGNIYISPTTLKFGTVKVGFHKKLIFSIYNPTITNFYIKIVPDPLILKKFSDKNVNENLNEENNNNKENSINNNNNKNNISITSKESLEKNDEILSFDFTEGLINSFCKKEITVTFKPITRAELNLHVEIFATEHNSKSLLNEAINKSLKSELIINANGDYPLIKICDVRNDIVGTNNLWHLFNVDLANEELQKQLTDEEKNYIIGGGDKMDKKINEMKEKLKCIKFDFGKHIKKKNAKINYFDVFLTLKNEGGVPSEFYFKFPDDISIKREIWMDPVEPTSNDKVEYHVLKEKIFEIEPRESKLDPGECCNIRLRYNLKEKGNHKLRVIFQVVNGKPLIMELNGICFSEKQGQLEIKRPVLDFSYVPIGYMDYIVSPIELYNVGGVKVKYKIDLNEVNKFNEANDDFIIFKLENSEGSIGPGDFKYIAVFFRPLTSKEYILPLMVYYIDDNNQPSNNNNNPTNNNQIISEIPITIKGKGYHPLKFIPPKIQSPFLTMPNGRMCNTFNDEIIQKCGVSVEEIDFGECEEKKVYNKTFILYNFSNTCSLNFDFREPGFILKDEIDIKPNKDKLEPNSHILIKMILTPKGYISEYNGEIEINITWNAENSNKVLDKEILHIRIRKQSKLKEITGNVEKSENENQCFIESLLTDLTREILSEETYQQMLLKNIDNQPLGIIDWTSDFEYSTQADVRKSIIEMYDNEAQEIINKDERLKIKEDKKRSTGKYVTNASHPSSNTSNNKAGNKNVNEGDENVNNANNNNIDEFGEKDDLEIQDKYMKELLDKYKLTIPEVNESLCIVNDESRKLISNDIMESTVYNIISEAVYGETNLTEKTRIYFFNK